MSEQLDHIGDARVPVTMVLSDMTVNLQGLGAMRVGSVVQIETNPGEPVILLAAGEPLARGEVGIVDDAFGLRATEIVRRHDG